MLTSKESVSTQTPAAEFGEGEGKEPDSRDGETTYYFTHTDGDTAGPSSTPVEAEKPYRFSDDIHKDRHIFLKGASVGIGCGNSDTASEGNGSYIDWNTLKQVGDGCFQSDSGYHVDEYGNVYYKGRCIQLGPGMALKGERLPSLHRVQLSIASADWSKRGQQERYPHVHQQHQPTPRQRPFNEQLNTYVDTQKRIRSVQCLEDLYRAPQTPGLPFLLTARRRTAVPRPTPRTPTVRFAATRQSTNLTSPKSSKTQTIHGDDHGSSALESRAAVSSSVARLPSVPLKNGRQSTTPRKKSSARASSESGEAEKELESARSVLKSSVPAMAVSSSYANYASADYLSSLSNEGRPGHFSRLFESYPKRILVHPGRLLLRQRTELFGTRTKP